jgi:tetratricopeptide (TPR) repeat protein
MKKTLTIFAFAVITAAAAFTQSGAGDLDKKIAEYTQTLSRNSNDAIAYYNRGNAYGNKGDVDSAIANFTQTIRLDPNYVSAYNNRGTAYVMKEDYARAHADWEKALQLDPNSDSVRHNLEQLRGMGY